VVLTSATRSPRHISSPIPGNLATRTWGSSAIAGAYTYDGAKRPDRAVHPPWRLSLGQRPLGHSGQHRLCLDSARPPRQRRRAVQLSRLGQRRLPLRRLRQAHRHIPTRRLRPVPPGRWGAVQLKAPGWSRPRVASARGRKVRTRDPELQNIVDVLYKPTSTIGQAAPPMRLAVRD
jgi:hypothetical protein